MMQGKRRKMRTGGHEPYQPARVICGLLSGQTLSHAGPPFADRKLIPKPVLHALAGSAGDRRMGQDV